MRDAESLALNPVVTADLLALTARLRRAMPRNANVLREQLLAMKPLPYGALPRSMPTSGVYLFTENGKHLYVGRSNALRGRHGRHCRPGATHRQAAFAFGARTSARPRSLTQKGERAVQLTNRRRCT
jgi:hypothetical protein